MNDLCYISVWKRRFEQERLKGLDSRYRGIQRRVRTAQMEAKILEATRKGPLTGALIGVAIGWPNIWA